MLDLMLVGGFVVALAGVFQVTSRRGRGAASGASLLRAGMEAFEGPDAEAVRAEFRRSGIALPERQRPAGFF